MSQICEVNGFDSKMHYTRTFLVKRAHGKRSSPLRTFAYKPIEISDFWEPYKGVRARDICGKKILFKDFEKILAIERQIIDESLEESSLKLCSKLRLAVGLSEEFEADENALANLDGFLADLAGERVDASDLVKTARRRL